mgnify:CR=1 FL=1
MSVATMSCTSPQFIKGHSTRRTVMVPCGQCFFCKRKISRRWIGKAMAETSYPVNMEHDDLHMIHKFDLTYAKTPMTAPIGHTLGEVNGSPFAGPWANNKWPDRRIEVNDLGQPFYTKNKKVLTDFDLRFEHRRSLIQRNGWDHKRVSDWESGSYDPIMTTSVKDIQVFIDRLKIALKRKRHDLLPIRYLVGTEYGGITGRPHAHIIIWGLLPDDATMVHDKWEGYQREAATNGHVHPGRHDCDIHRASIVTGGAESYSVKDVPKARHLSTGNPSILEQETPRVFGSKVPPIGEGAFLPWMEKQIYPSLQRAESLLSGTAGDREVQQTVFLRQIYTAFSVRLKPDEHGRPRNETFPTTTRWREKCRRKLGIPDSVWDAATVQIETRSANETELLTNDPELVKLHDEHTTELRERRDAIQERQASRIQEKRTKLIAAGKLQRSG